MLIKCSSRLWWKAFQLVASDLCHFRRLHANQHFHAGKPSPPQPGANCCLLRRWKGGLGVGGNSCPSCKETEGSSQACFNWKFQDLQEM